MHSVTKAELALWISEFWMRSTTLIIMKRTGRSQGARCYKWSKHECRFCFDRHWLSSRSTSPFLEAHPRNARLLSTSASEAWDVAWSSELEDEVLISSTIFPRRLCLSLTTQAIELCQDWQSYRIIVQSNQVSLQSLCTLGSSLHSW